MIGDRPQFSIGLEAKIGSGLILVSLIAWYVNYRTLAVPNVIPVLRWVGVVGALLLAYRAFSGALLNRAWDVLLFLALVFMSVLFSSDVKRSLIELVRLVAALSFYWLAVSLPVAQSQQLVRSAFGGAIALVLGSYGVAVAAGGEFVQQLPRYFEGVVRFSGATWHPGITGLVSALTFAFALAWRPTGRRGGIARWALLLLASTLVGLANSRTGMIAIAVVVVFYLSAKMWPRAMYSGRPAVLAVLAVTAVPLAMHMLGATFAQEHFSVRSQAVLERLNASSAALQAFQANWLTGVGFGTNGPMVARYSFDYRVTELVSLRYYHHWLLTAMAATGILGASSMCAMIATSVSRCWRAAGVASDKFGSGIPLAGALAVLAISTFAAFEGALQDSFASFALWFAVRGLADGVLVNSSVARA